ncbi:TetR/AcrR family transcriptional regulator [Ideonella sp. BN130291]|uniref:TetR/AcrR family transcriptional regulator n=1 Tax=Ideonella sp. BN130291 TaxID=3112940 RepID=UPI002E264AEB|nr:helix-turn-helix domain-containing protein [Ideonella sp. BN130291]
MRTPAGSRTRPDPLAISRSRPAAKRPAVARARATGAPATEPAAEVRDRILDTASRLFYERGVRAVGVDLVVLEAAVAKTSLYRYFPTKDDLIVAFLEREDVDFWAQWDSVSAQFADDPAGELDAHMCWIGERLARSNYRGCPQINVAAEFAEHDHPAREVARRHMQALRSRLHVIAKRLRVPRPQQLAAQLAVLVNGAFVSAGLLSPDEATGVLRAALKALLAGAKAGA